MIVPYRTILYVTVFKKNTIATLFVIFTVTFYPVSWSVTVNVTFLVTENIPLHLPLPLLSLPHAKKYGVTGIVLFLVTRDRDRNLSHYFNRHIFICNGKFDGKSNGKCKGTCHASLKMPVTPYFLAP